MRQEYIDNALLVAYHYSTGNCNRAYVEEAFASLTKRELLAIVDNIKFMQKEVVSILEKYVE